MGMDSPEAGGSPDLGRRLASWVAIILMNIWVPILMFLETMIGIAIFPIALVVWRLVTRWPFSKIMRHFVWIYGRTWMWIVSPFVRFKLIGADPAWAAVPSIYVVNHLSLFDIFCMAVLPVFDVVICLRAWPFKMIWFAPFMRLAEYIDVESLPWEDIVGQTGKLFDERHSVMVFPQGHRSRNGRLGRFYSGAFKLALQFEVPIIPLCITGTDQVFPPGRRWLKPAHVRMECLEPIDPAKFKGELGHLELRRHVKEKMEACLASASV